MNVQEAWLMGYTGKGVVVTILDDGLEKNHPDITQNYDPLASYDINNQDADPQPRYDRGNSNRHGTRCAGEVAAHANNSQCVVGVAFDAKIGGVRMLDGEVTDAVEAASLSLNPQHIDIYSASWGPDDDGRTVDGPGMLAKRAFMRGVQLGRNELGSIFVWASGNGGRDYDSCNVDGYTNAVWTLSISSATDRGNVPWYLERCSSTLATTYSSGAAMERQIITTDLHGKCTATHTGTSASAPIAAGVCALALQANAKLSWRDMQHLVVRTARKGNLKADDWQQNGVGRNFSHAFGYGLLDASAMALMAETWVPTPEQHICEIGTPHRNLRIPTEDEGSLRLEVSTKHCRKGTSREINYVEHVQAKVTLSAMRRGDIEIFLISPMGTRTTLLARRPRDHSRDGFRNWPFMSVHFWGELADGNWTLEIVNVNNYGTWANLYGWSLVLYGSAEPAQPDDYIIEKSDGVYNLRKPNEATTPADSDNDLNTKANFKASKSKWPVMVKGENLMKHFNKFEEIKSERNHEIHLTASKLRNFYENSTKLFAIPDEQKASPSLASKPEVSVLVFAILFFLMFSNFCIIR